MKNLKMKSILWFSVATISCGVIVPLAYQAHTYTQKMQTRNQAKQEQIATFKDVDINQLDSLITEQLDSSANNEYKTQLHSANPNSGEYEMPPEINYHEEVKNNALKIISGEYLIIDLQEKFYQEYVGNEDKYQAIVGDYANINNLKSISYSQNNYAYSTNDSESLGIVDINVLYNLDEILKKMNDHFIGLKVMAGVTTASTVIAWGVAAFYWSAWWMFGGNVPFAIAASVQASTLTIMTNDVWNEYYSTDADIRFLNDLNACITTEEKYNLKLLIDTYKGKRNLAKAITILFLDNPWLSSFEKKVIAKLSNWVIKGIILFSEKVLERACTFINKTLVSKAIAAATSWSNPIIAVLSIVDTTLSICNMALMIWKFSIFQI